MSPPVIHDQPLPYVHALPLRAADAVDMVVMHCTELPDLATAREYGERIVHPSGTGNSGHYYIDRDGATYCYVPGDRIAHHVRGHNEHAIGIELVNAGRYPHWWDTHHQRMSEPYPATQITALLALLAHLRERFAHLATIAGHEDLDTALVAASDDPAQQVRRKLDPGPMFPWEQVLAGCGLVRVHRSP
jgi:N-acetylmuramoyl-L-alanine amidase